MINLEGIEFTVEKKGCGKVLMGICYSDDLGVEKVFIMQFRVKEAYDLKFKLEEAIDKAKGI